MSEQKIFIYDLEFKMKRRDGSIVSEPGTAFFKETSLELTGASGTHMSILLRDISSFEEKNYRIYINLVPEEALELFYLGRNYGDFLDQLLKARNSLIKQDLLMHESLLFVAEGLEYTYFDAEGQAVSHGACDAQVSDTALILASPDGNHLKFPLSYVSNIQEKNFTLSVLMENGEHVLFRMLGRQLEPLHLNIGKAIKKLEDKAHLLCESLFGTAHEKFSHELSVLFKDGRAVNKKQLDAFSYRLWPEMEKRLDSCGLEETYHYLLAYGDVEHSSIGFKRGLMGDLTGEYVWFLIPMRDKKIIAMEAGSTSPSGGLATYFFKLPEDCDTDKFIAKINYGLFMVNFRREPIYLTDEQLEKPAYKEYHFALEKLPSLRMLRKLFIGRIIHASREQWEKKLQEILD